MEPLDQRARVAVTFLWITIAITLVSMYAEWDLIQFLNGVQSGETVDYDRADSVDQNTMFVGLAALTVLVATAITFLMWFHRAHRNLTEAGLSGMKYTPGWAVGGFFVPFLNLVRPYSVMKEVSMGSVYLAEKAQAITEGGAAAIVDDDPLDGMYDSGWLDTFPDAEVGMWWGFYVTQSILSGIATRMSLRGEDADILITSSWISILSGVAAIPAALYAIKLVKTITANQEAARLQRENAMIA